MSSPPSFKSATLRALLNRLIPPDDFPGALESGVESYLVAQWQGDDASEAAGLARGLAQLDLEAAARHSGLLFSHLTTQHQDSLLGDLEGGRTQTEWPAEIPAKTFLDRIINLAHEGFYADPGNGGNREAGSWKMVGYDPRIPARPVDGLPFAPAPRIEMPASQAPRG
jgi:hypothetical protein